MLKATFEKKAAQHQQEMRIRRLAERQNSRPLIEVPPFDAPWLPQVQTINDVLGPSTASEPPARDIDGVASRARKLALRDSMPSRAPKTTSPEPGCRRRNSGYCSG